MNRPLPLRLKILTPTFIGNGNKLLPIEVYDEGKTAKVFKFDNLTRQVSEIFPPAKLRNLMLRLAGEVSKEQKVKPLKEVLRELNLRVDKLKPDYTLKVEGNYDHRKVEEFIKTLEGVYIPGSEIKGAIRTAIFYHILMTYGTIWEQFMRELKWFLKNFNPKSLKPFAQHWENKIFANKPLKENFKGKESPKGKEDLLKFLQVEDSEIKDPSEVLVLKQLYLKQSKKNLTPWVESLKENSTFRFKIRWNSEGARRFIETYLKGMERELKEFWETLNEEKLLKITDRFTRDLITFEEAKREGNGAGYRKTPPPKGGDYLEILLKGETARRDTKTLGKLKKEKGYLIRLGKFTGRLTHSILLAVYHKDRKLFESTVKGKFKHKTYWEDQKGNPLGFGKLIPA